MKKLTLVFLALFAFSFSGHSQASEYNLKSQNLHKKVAKTISHYYTYHEKSGGFVKQSVSINTYNDKGNLIETYFNYNSTYDGSSSTTSKIYNYNSKNQLISTQDISPKKSDYSSYYKFYYDTNGNVTKKETHYNNGTFSYIKYLYDNRERLINSESYSSDGILNNRTTNNYNGSIKTEVSKSYDSKDGSLIGTYTTKYKNDLKVSYNSESKYGKTHYTYTYDNNDNLISSINREKSNYNTSYNYEYDNKDNWIKKHYKSGNYHYFYFREIIFKNGNTTGNVNFDKNFINRHGNFNNVNVVSIIPSKTTTTTKNTTTNTTTNIDMPSFTSKNWTFNYVNLNNKVSSLSGEVTLNVLDNSQMSKNSKVSISYSFEGKKYADTYIVNSYLKMEDYGFWTLKSTTKETTASVSIYTKKKYVSAKDLYLSGMVMLTFNGKKTSFYLE